MLWLSSHTFTTVGYGSIYPTCAGGQILVVVEQYAAFLLGGFMCSIILVRAMQPAARFRFAKVALITLGDEHDPARLSVRLSNISRYSLSKVTAEARCLMSLGSRGANRRAAHQRRV